MSTETKQTNTAAAKPVDPKAGTTAVQPQGKNSEIAMQVLAKIEKFEELGQLNLPKDYSPGNNLNAAYLILSETVDKDGKPVLESCSRESIANSLFKMVVLGLSVVKRQCSFVPYGGKLTLMREYQGSIALAKRYGGVKEINGNAIYEGDDFKYSIEAETGRKKILKHEQSIGNIDMNKIVGAYAIAVLEDGSTDAEIMNMGQIRKAWEQGYAKGNSPAHRNFTDEMSAKVVIGRLCKNYINSSNDAAVMDDDEDESQTEKKAEAKVQHKLISMEQPDFTEAEEIKPIATEQSNTGTAPQVAETQTISEQPKSEMPTQLF